MFSCFIPLLRCSLYLCHQVLYPIIFTNAYKCSPRLPFVDLLRTHRVRACVTSSCILDRTPAQAIITASHLRTQLSLTSPPQTQTHRTSALMNKTTSPRPLANPQFYSSPIPSHTQSHKSNHRYNSPTQTPVQVTTINYPIRFTPPSPFALHLQLRPLYANRSYINSSNEQAYLPAYPSASTREYNIPNNMHRPPCPPAGSYHGLPASA
jgi:hypothetical protein